MAVALLAALATAACGGSDGTAEQAAEPSGSAAAVRTGYVVPDPPTYVLTREDFGVELSYSFYSAAGDVRCSFVNAGLETAAEELTDDWSVTCVVDTAPADLGRTEPCETGGDRPAHGSIALMAGSGTDGLQCSSFFAEYGEPGPRTPNGFANGGRLDPGQSLGGGPMVCESVEAGMRCTDTSAAGEGFLLGAAAYETYDDEGAVTAAGGSSGTGQSPDPDGTAGVSTFTTPDGNIACALWPVGSGPPFVECEAATADWALPEAAACAGGTAWAGTRLRATFDEGVDEGLCAGEPLLVVPPETVDYGSSVGNRAFHCSVDAEADQVTCTDMATAGGFRISAGSHEVFGPARSATSAPEGAVDITPRLPSGSGRSYAFTSPSGNLYCVFYASEGYFVGCSAEEADWAVPVPFDNCPAGVEDTRLSVSEFGDTTTGGCAFPREAAEPLPYGQAVRVHDPAVMDGGLFCLSEEAGITCRDEGSDAGFRISRASYEVF